MTRKSQLLILLFTCLSFSMFALSPAAEYSVLPKDMGLKYESYKVNDGDKLSINCWYMPAPGSYKIVIISHDGTRNMGAHLERAKLFVELGFSVLTYDYRGFGGSSTFPIDPYEFIYKEFFDDLNLVIKDSEKRHGKDLVLYGWGLGASISLHQSYLHSSILGTIADDPYVSFAKLDQKFTAINAAMNTPDLGSPYEPYYFVKKDLSDDFRGILYLHGSNNLLVSDSDMNELFERTKYEFKSIHVFKKSARADNFTLNKHEYSRQVYAFALNL
ncbi:alpha/beta hydrolase [Reichenbachiella ulvae]|uniref:Alpha/beta hydrolase n=1 Tax=Reichenbachiella ulvae TaxID=2980104 RepID=A0ABT3CQQ3_9BACT|nr:alpha/beta fold hydrolase [Reichenbachiella ulvae]MCV9385906.1 alpha/beta hydrolase [Reichenbachiella ulvae]